MKLITGYVGDDGKWYIRIANARNKKTLADGGEGYASKFNVKRAISHNWKDGYVMKCIRETPTLVSYRMVPRVQTNR